MGNSHAAGAAARAGSVHPHVHGELYLEVLDRAARIGSSPRAWGTHGGEPVLDLLDRFIPTCMGNSVSESRTSIHSSVHPHVHGELGCHSLSHLLQYGSSPRAWGTHHLPEHLNRLGRFIPTCMGNSFFRLLARVPRTVHPHVHGELFSIFP